MQQDTAPSPVQKRKNLTFADFLYDIFGCGLFAAGVQCFSAPNQIAPGGISGVAILINYVTGLPVSMFTLLFNAPLLVAAWFLLGRRFTIRTMKSVLIMSLMLQLALRLPVYQGERMLAALYAGVLEGIGLALVFMRGSTTGGSDIASRLLQLKFPNMPVGRLILIIDAVVFVGAALVYKSIESALYAMIAIYTCTGILDSLLYGMDAGKVLMIMSLQNQEIARQINQRRQRGCTLLHGTGSYTGADRSVLMCAVRRNQYFETKRLVYDIDPNAFMLALEASEVLGKGFRVPSKDH
jgi:Uncharacterized conserved protein